MENVNSIDEEEIYEESIEKAKKLMEEQDKVEKLLKNLNRKLEGLLLQGDTLMYVPKMTLMIYNLLRKKYNKVSLARLDVIPDILPVVGFLDDIGVAGLALSRVSKELDEYTRWRLRMGLDEAEPAE